MATGGHKSPHWQETPRLSWLEDNYICQCMIINVWLIMRLEDVISILLCSKASVMSTKSSLQSNHCWHIPLRGLPLRGKSVTSLGLTACRFKTPYSALRGIPMRLKMAGALIPVLLRAITLQRRRIVVRGISRQYQYYWMFCLVTDIVGSNLKSKNQEVSGFSDQLVLNAKVDFNETWT